MEILTRNAKSTIKRATNKNLYEYNRKENDISLKGITYKKGYIFESDAFVLSKIKQEYPKENEGKVIDKKGNLVSDVPFKKLELVVESCFSNVVSKSKFDIDEFLKYSDRIILASKSAKNKGMFLVKSFGNFFRLDVFSEFITELKKKRQYLEDKCTINDTNFTTIGNVDNCVTVCPIPFSNLNVDSKTFDMNTFIFDYEANKFVLANNENTTCGDDYDFVQKYNSYFE